MLCTSLIPHFEPETTFFLHKVNKWRKFKDSITYVKGKTWLSELCKEQ